MTLAKEVLGKFLADIVERVQKKLIIKLNAKSALSVYNGQTSRAPKICVKEHAKAIATLDKNSLLAQHHMLH